MTSVNVIGRDWFRTIDEDLDDPSITCYRIGGELSKAVLKDGIHDKGITKEVLNSCFDTKKLPYEKVNRVARGYLFWRFGDGQAVRVISRSSNSQTPASASDSDYQKLFGSLDKRSLRVVLSVIDITNPYWMQFLNTEVSLFRNIWGVLSTTNKAKKIAATLKVTVCNNPIKYGIEKLLIVLNSRGIQGVDSDHNIIRKFAKKMPVAQVQQVWKLLQGEQSLSAAFLETVELRAWFLSQKPEAQITTGPSFRRWLSGRNTLSAFLRQVGRGENREIDTLTKQLMLQLALS